MTTPTTRPPSTSEEITIRTHHLGPDKPALSASESELYQGFLSTHLEKWGDPPEEIAAAFAYAHRRGGLVVSAWLGEHVVGVVLTNETGMGGYVPENLLVYAAVDPSCRGKGIGGTLVSAVQETVSGDIALHVEADNPAKRLYERCGFTAPYQEMRWRR